MTNRNKPATEEIYHVFNRGVEKRKVFLDVKDHQRFLNNLAFFNDKNPALNISYLLNKNIEVGLQYRDKLVEIMAFVLMPNHYHLMIKQSKENGITEFMRKVGTGYTNYFNQKYKRVGPLFQGKYKAQILKKNEHFIHLPYYIHFNPLDLTEHSWRERKIKNAQKAMDFLKSYKWSSLKDYLGIETYPSILNGSFKEFTDTDKYETEITEWLTEGDREIVKQTIDSN